MATKSIQTWLEDLRLLGEEQFQVASAVRTLVSEQFKPFAEELKYGGILFSSGVQFCGVFAYKAHVSVEFGQGTRINDELGHLEGAGKGRRHLKLACLADIKTKQLAHYLTLALQAAQSNP